MNDMKKLGVIILLLLTLSACRLEPKTAMTIECQGNIARVDPKLPENYNPTSSVYALSLAEGHGKILIPRIACFAIIKEE